MSVAGAQAVQRAMDVLRTVAQLQRSGAKLARVAKASGLSTPTAHRLLRALTHEAMLTYDKAERCYRIGPLACELGMAAAHEVRVDPSWQAIVTEVARRTRLTSYLIARSGDEAVCLWCAQGSMTIRAIPMEVGQRVPLGIGAGSLALLSSLDDAEVLRILAAHDHRYGAFPGGEQHTDALQRRIAETRERGFSISSGSVATGVTGIGVLTPTGMAPNRFAVTVSAVASTFALPEAQSLAATISAVIAGTSA